MFESFKSFASAGKDSIISSLVKKLANHRLSDKYPGTTVEDFTLDSQNKTISATLQMPEFDTPLTIKATGYQITEHNGKHFLEIDTIEKSQPWENSYIDGKRYKIPPEVVKVAALVL